MARNTHLVILVGILESGDNLMMFSCGRLNLTVNLLSHETIFHHSLPYIIHSGERLAENELAILSKFAGQEKKIQSAMQQ